MEGKLKEALALYGNSTDDDAIPEQYRKIFDESDRLHDEIMKAYDDCSRVSTLKSLYRDFLRRHLTQEDNFAIDDGEKIPWNPSLEQQMGFKSEREMRKVLARTESVDIEYEHHYSRTKDMLDLSIINFRVTYNLKGSRKVVKHVHAFPVMACLLEPVEIGEIIDNLDVQEDTLRDESWARDKRYEKLSLDGAKPYDKGTVYPEPNPRD